MASLRNELATGGSDISGKETASLEVTTAAMIGLTAAEIGGAYKSYIDEDVIDHADWTLIICEL